MCIRDRYKRAGFDMFDELVNGIQTETVRRLFPVRGLGAGLFLSLLFRPQRLGGCFEMCIRDSVSACAPSRVSMMLATSSTVFSGISISPFGRCV